MGDASEVDLSVGALSWRNYLLAERAVGWSSIGSPAAGESTLIHRGRQPTTRDMRRNSRMFEREGPLVVTDLGRPVILP